MGHFTKVSRICILIPQFICIDSIFKRSLKICKMLLFSNIVCAGNPAFSSVVTFRFVLSPFHVLDSAYCTPFIKGPCVRPGIWLWGQARVCRRSLRLPFRPDPDRWPDHSVSLSFPCESRRKGCSAGYLGTRSWFCRPFSLGCCQVFRLTHVVLSKTKIYTCRASL